MRSVIEGIESSSANPIAPFWSRSLWLERLLPSPLITLDQIRLLKYDNIKSGKYKTNFDIGFENLKDFNEEVEKYSYMWKKGGEFSKKNK